MTVTIMEQLKKKTAVQLHTLEKGLRSINNCLTWTCNSTS